MLLVSNELSLKTKALLNLGVEKKVKLTVEQYQYIGWNRENIFHK